MVTNARCTDIGDTAFGKITACTAYLSATSSVGQSGGLISRVSLVQVQGGGRYRHRSNHYITMYHKFESYIVVFAISTVGSAIVNRCLVCPKTVGGSGAPG